MFEFNYSGMTKRHKRMQAEVDNDTDYGFYIMIGKDPDCQSLNGKGIKTVNRIAEYRAKRDAIEGIN